MTLYCFILSLLALLPLTLYHIVLPIIYTIISYNFLKLVKRTDLHFVYLCLSPELLGH